MAAVVLLVRAEMEARRRAGARRVFPLRLGRQPIRPPGLAREPGEVGLRVVPRQARRRMSAGLREVRLAPAVARALVEAAVLPYIANRSGIVPGLVREGCELS